MKFIPTGNVFIAAAPRSGSMHLANGFGRLGYKFASSHVCLEGYHNEEHMVDMRAAAVLFPLGGFVFHQHVRAVGPNAAVLAEYGVKPIITYRNILDTLVSLREQLNSKYALGKSDTFLPIHQPNWPGMSDEEKDWWVAYNMLPWYYSFLVSWLEAPIEKLFVRYETHYADQPAGIRRILEFLGIQVPPEAVLAEITAHHDGNFNVGRTGRGIETLPRGVVNMAYDQATKWGDWSERLRQEFLP